MVTNWVDEELSYELDDDDLTKEEKIHNIMVFWGCSRIKAIAFYNYKNNTK